MTKKNFSIQLIRTVAMFMIIFDHIFNIMDIPMKSAVSQLLNSGVFIFLFISGYLYGKKEIGDWRNWFKTRIIRICVPMWIFILVDFIVEALLWNIFEIKFVFIYALNLQGVFWTNIGGMPLWFLTLLMICYLITPILQKIKRINLKRKYIIVIAVLSILLQGIFAYTTNVGLVAGHSLSWCIVAVAIYIIGYYYGKRLLQEKSDLKFCVIWIICAVVTLATLLIGNIKFDDKIIYTKIISTYGMAIISQLLCIILYKIGQKIKEGVLYKCIAYFDRISYEIYLVHQLIISAIAIRVSNEYGEILYVLCAFLFSWVAAIILNKITGIVQAYLYRKTTKPLAHPPR